jgi:hypothetical protein
MLLCVARARPPATCGSSSKDKNASVPAATTTLLPDLAFCERKKKLI